MQTDPIADMLTRIRNAARAKQARLDVPASKLKIEIARILKEEGFIATYKVAEDNRVKKSLRIFLKYTADRHSVFSDLRRISRPGRRVYAGKNELQKVMGGMGISILTTPKGVMSGKTARKSGVGGEVLCEVW
jgi:small subunit ribosomal protein S8